MSNRTYPYQAWVLMPSFKPSEVTIEGPYHKYWSHERDVTSSGKSYALTELYPNKDAAIDAGSILLDKQEAALSKKQANIDKRREALRKAMK